MEIEGDQELSSGRKAKAARTEKLPPAVEGRAEGVSSPSSPDKVKALFTGAVMTPELAPKSTLQEERNLCPQSGLSPPGVNMNTPWWEGAGAAPHPSQQRKEGWEDGTPPPHRTKKEGKKTDTAREGWEDGTPPTDR